MKGSPPPPTKRRRCDAVCRAEALRLAGESRATQAAARALNINPKRLYQWQQEALAPVAAATGGGIGPGHGHWVAPVAGRQPAASAGTGRVKESRRQQTLAARYRTDTGPMSPCRFIAAQRDHYPGRRLCPLVQRPASAEACQWLLRLTGAAAAVVTRSGSTGLGSGAGQGLRGP